MGGVARRNVRRFLLSVLVGVIPVVMVLLGVRESSALSVEKCLSNDNHVYMIITSGTGDIGTQVTSVALTGGSASVCGEAPVAGAVLTAISVGQGSLLPGRKRTDVLSGFANNTINCNTNFSQSAQGGQGELTLPGGSKVSVAVPGGGGGFVPLVDVTTAGGGVPAAVDHAGSRTITGCSVSGATMVFPQPTGAITESDVTSGEVSGQNVTFDDTQGTHVANMDPGGVVTKQTSPDGFLLQGNCGGGNLATCQLIVFVAGQGSAASFGAAAAGFSINSSSIVGSTEAALQNQTFNPPQERCEGVTGVLRSLPRR